MIIQLRDIEFSISEFKEYKNVNLAKFMLYIYIYMNFIGHVFSDFAHNIVSAYTTYHIILFQHILLTTKAEATSAPA